MNKQYTVTQAIDFLNKSFLGYAPKNEETLRRAIRSGKLKAEVRRGKEGSLIDEKDLIEYGRGYALRLQVTNTDFEAAKTGGIQLETDESPKRFIEIIKEVQEANSLELTEYKIRLMEARRKWAAKEGVLRAEIQKLQIELDDCQMELALFEKEISDGEYYAAKK